MFLYFVEKENIASKNNSALSVNSEISETSKMANLFDPRIAHGLLDFVGMLWLIHGKDLLLKENAESLKNLYNACAKCLPLVLRLFKVSISIYCDLK